MYNKVVFYNHFGNGDIFESREFVKEYMQKIPAHEYFYANGKPEYLLDGLGDIKHTEVTELMDARKAWVKDQDNLYINTWIGRDSRYVLPGIGCVVEELYRMHNDILASLSLPLLEKSVYNYIPALKFSELLDIEDRNYMSFTENSNKRVFISNGPVQSNQAENFDFTPIINKLCDVFTDHLFYVTSPTNLIKDNLYDLGTWNLHELAYKASFCPTIIGRNSGPHVFAQNLNNWNDPTKACLSFTYQKVASHFVLSDHFPMRKYWSPATNTDEVYNKIVEVLGR